MRPGRLLSLVGAVLAWAAAARGDPGASVRTLEVPLPRLDQPRSFAVASDRAVWAVEDLGGRLVRGRTGDGLEPVENGRPRLVAADPDGVVVALVGETGSFRLVTHGPGGRREAPLATDPPPADPVGLDARDGIAWVVDRDPPRVFLFAYDGALLAWTDLAGRARAPFSVAVGPSGEAYVTDPAGPGVWSFAPTGALVGPVDLGGTGFTRPTGIAVDPSGRVWVSDGVTGCVVLLDPGRSAGPVRCEGRTVRFGDPLRLRWRDGLWVLDASAGRVWKVLPGAGSP
ncbi:NHL repeat-containing protein [Deferrisoma palaeochoriense]